MNIGCPKCKQDNDIEGVDLPDRACDDADYKCIYCEHTFAIGWCAEVELR